jgi:hypothetical protein
MFNKPRPASVTSTPAADQGPTLAELENVISEGLDTVLRVGTALMQIKKRELYRDRYATWEAYLDARWRMTANYAHKLMEAAGVCLELKEAGLPELVREAHARELRKVPADKRPAAWKETLDAAGGKVEDVTAALVASVAAKHRTKKARRKKPRTIVLTGKGWKLSLERKTIDVDPIAALNEALSKMTATSTTSTPAAA